MYVVVNRLNKCQGAMGFHLQVRLLRWSRNTASGIREPTQLKSRPSASLARVDRRLLAPLFSPSVPADPQRCSPATRQEKSRHENSGRTSARKSPAKCGRCAFSLSCLFGDDEVAEIGSLFRGSFSPEDE